MPAGYALGRMFLLSRGWSWCDEPHHRAIAVAHRVLLLRSSPTHTKEPMHMSNAALSFEAIDFDVLSTVTGGAPQGGQPQPQPNFLERWGQNMQKGGEYAMAAGAVGTVVPGLGETGIPEGVAAGGGAAWLLGKGTEAVGSLFH
jgi:hypothetical protein